MVPGSEVLPLKSLRRREITYFPKSAIVNKVFFRAEFSDMSLNWLVTVNILAQKKDGAYKHYTYVGRAPRNRPENTTERSYNTDLKKEAFPKQILVFMFLQYISFETLWEKEKLLVTSKFSFSNSVFYPPGELFSIFIKFESVVCKLFQFGRV